MRNANLNPAHRSRSGAVLFEMAIVLPLLLSLTFGACEWGYFIFAKNALQGAAREGARAAIVTGGTASAVQTAVDTAMLNSGFAQSKYTRPPTITDQNGVTINFATVTSGTPIIVTVSSTWGTIGFTPSLTISSGKAMSAAVTMRKE